MPAKSKAQRRFMAMCEHDKAMPGMKCPSKAVAKKFSGTKEKGLPARVTPKKKRR